MVYKDSEQMRKKRYPSGERKDRTTKVLEYIASHPGCRRSHIGAHMKSLYTIRPQTVSEYLKGFLMYGIIEEKNGFFFITKKGGTLLRKRQAQGQL